MMEIPAFMTAGHVEQLAKMSRLPKNSPDQLSRSIPAVKLRNVTYRPPEPAKETMTKQKHDISSDSNTDIDTPRLPTQVDSNKQLFQKNSLPDHDDDLSVDERSQLERLQNKLRQREKQRLLREENVYPRKENRRRRVYTKRERDRMRKHGGQIYCDDSHDDAMSDIDFRHLRGYHSGRSGCSTPGGSLDEMKLGRNMRAAPRRIETKDGVRMSQKNSTSKHDEASSQPLLEVDHNRPQNVVTEYYHNTHLPQKATDLNQRSEVKPSLGSSISPQHPTQDLIEILNRRQQLLQQQREDRRSYLQDQEAKEKAREIVNLAYLNADSAVARKMKEEKTKEGEKLLDDAFSLAKNSKNFEFRDHSESRDDVTSPKPSQKSAVDQLWSNGHIQEEKHSSETEHNKGDNFFDESPKQGTSNMETDDHMIKYVRDELQRLET